MFSSTAFFKKTLTVPSSDKKTPAPVTEEKNGSKIISSFLKELSVLPFDGRKNKVINDEIWSAFKMEIRQAKDNKNEAKYLELKLNLISLINLKPAAVKEIIKYKLWLNLLSKVWELESIFHALHLSRYPEPYTSILFDHVLHRFEGLDDQIFAQHKIPADPFFTQEPPRFRNFESNVKKLEREGYPVKSTLHLSNYIINLIQLLEKQPVSVEALHEPSSMKP